MVLEAERQWYKKQRDSGIRSLIYSNIRSERAANRSRSDIDITVEWGDPAVLEAGEATILESGKAVILEAGRRGSGIRSRRCSDIKSTRGSSIL
jgi:hypothetical protein